MPVPLERRLTLHQLRIFKSVIDSHSFTRAAEALALTQPAVTHQMQALTKSVGHPLINPSRRSPQLTAVGKVLYDRASRILSAVGDAEQAIDDLVELRAGTLRIAGDTTVGTYVLPDALAGFHRLYPHVELSLDVVNRTAVRDLVVDGTADFGVVGRLWEDDAL